MALKSKKIFNLIIIAILMVVFINILSFSNYNGVCGVYAETPGETSGVADTTSEPTEQRGFIPIVKDTIALWYYVFRYFSIIAMLVVLIYLGIQLAITSIAADKAKYKRMLVDWVIGFVMVFGIHYFMVLIINLNESCLNVIKNISEKTLERIAADSGGIVNSISLYETIRTRAYEFRVGIGTAGMIMYMVLVYYTIRFAIIYFKRFFTVMILTIIAPLVGLSYAFTKVMTGKAPILSKWGGEYCFNIFLQTIHALIYTVFVSIALALSAESIAGFIVALIMLNFMLKADKILRKIFKISGGLLDDNADKDMKENFAALTGMRASMGNVFKSEMAKDTKDSLKRGIGAVTNVGMVAGFKAYNRELKKHDSELFDKKLESEQMEAQLASGALSKQESKKIEKQKAELDEQIARMEGRRNKMKKYTEPIEKNSAVGQYRNAKKEPKRDAKIDAEYERRIQKRKDMGLSALDEKKQQELRKQVEREINNQVKRRNVYKDERTGQKEVIDGVGYQLKHEINRAIWGNDAVKGATKKMFGDTANRIAGQAMIFAAIPLTVANPMVGMAMLGKGMKKAKSTNKFRGSANLRQRRSLIKGSRKRAKKEKEKYKFNRFSPGAINTIQAKERRDMASNMVRKINNPTISMRLFTLPLQLTGIASSARIIAENQYKIESAKKKYYESQEAGYAVARKNSINDDYVFLYRNTVKGIYDKYSSLSEDEMILENKQETGTIFDVNGTKIEFTDTSICSLTESDLIDNVILSVAEMNNIVDLNDLNTSNKVIQTQLIEQLSSQGLLKGKENLSVDEPTKELTSLVKNLEQRKQRLSKTTIAREKLVQVVTAGYMQEHGIDNPDEIKSGEHAEKIKEIVFERIEQGKPQTEEDKMQLEVEEIVKIAYASSTDPIEINSQIEGGISKLFAMQEEAKKDQSFADTLDELRKRRNGGKETSDTVTEEVIEDTELDTRTQEIVSKKTKKFMESFNVEDILASIRNKQEEQEETIKFVEDVLSNVKKVEEKPTLNKEEIKRVETSGTIIADEITAKRDREIRKLNEELKTFDSVESVDNITDEFIEEHSSGKYDELIGHLIASMEENKVLVDLKIKKPDDKRILAMKRSDETKANNTYKMSVEDIIKSVNGK